MNTKTAIRLVVSDVAPRLAGKAAQTLTAAAIKRAGFFFAAAGALPAVTGIVVIYLADAAISHLLEN